MAKRNADRDLTHENWNIEEEEEEPGTFVTANASDLRKRVIKRARRSIGTRDPPIGSPFASFSGFTSSNPPTELINSPNPAETEPKLNEEKRNGNFRSQKTSERRDPPLGSPFASFSGFTTPKPRKELIHSPNPAETEPKQNEEKHNGSSEGIKSKDSTANDVPSPSSTAQSSSSGTYLTRSMEYYRQLQSLNESVMKWMQLHLSKNPCCDFNPVFTDYKKHLDTLNVTYPAKKNPCSSPPTRAEDKTKSGCKRQATDFSAGLPSKISNTASSNFFKMGNSTSLRSEKDETDYGAHFASNTTNTSTFSFGMKCHPTGTSSITPKGPTTTSSEKDIPENEKSPTISFSFKSKAEEQEKSTESQENKPFSFSFNSVAKQTENETSEEKEYVPPKNEFTAVSEEGAIYSKRCKLFFKKDDNFAEKGVGTLFLKPLEEKMQLLIRADTSLGNVLLNIFLSASLPMSRTGKNNVLIVCVPNPPLDVKNPGAKEAIPMLIRVKTEEDANELLKLLNEHKS